MDIITTRLNYKTSQVSLGNTKNTNQNISYEVLEHYTYFRNREQGHISNATDTKRYHHLTMSLLLS
jgi:hypothetical protein